MSLPKKILHFADIQVEARNNEQRAFEYKAAFQRLLSEIYNDEDITVVVFSGDAFEFPHPNDIERQLWTEFLNQIPDNIEVVMIDGNHDLVQKNNAYLVDGLNQEQHPSPISTLALSINKSNIRYFRNTDFYQSINHSNLWFGVWSHTQKYNFNYDGVYSPYDMNNEQYQKIISNTDNLIIDLYHDPVSSAINWDGQLVHGADKHINVNRFHTLCLAGDIHKPGIYTNNGVSFTYPSSLVIRDFGEGDYYDGLRLYQYGNDKHGFNIVTVSSNGLENIDFKPFKPPVAYNTIRFTNSFNYSPETIKLLNITNHGTTKTLIRLVVESNHLKFGEYEAGIRQQLMNVVPNAKIVNTVWGKDVLLSDQVEIDNLNLDKGQLISNESIIGIAKTYIEKRVKSSTAIQKDDKDAVIQELNDLFLSELNNIDRENNVKVFSLISADINNFMALGDGVHIDFARPESKELVRIIGANGTGKTTLYHFINWIFTDQISHTQSPKYKRENYLSYFTDYKLDVDQIGGSIIFELNNTQYILKKQLTRSWKSGSKKLIDSWMDDVDGIPVLNISLESLDGKFNLTSNQDVIEWLNTNVGNFYDLSRLMFVNYQNLYDLINSKSAELNDQILYNLGLNFFDTLAKRYDEIRSEKMAGVYKPEQSIQELNDNIKSLNESKVNNDLELIRWDEMRSDHETKQAKLVASTEELRSKIINMGYTKEQALLGITALENNIATEQGNIFQFNDSITVIEKQISDIESLKPDLTLLEISLGGKEKELVELRSVIQKHNSDKELITSNIKVRGLEIKQQNDDLIKDIEKQKSELSINRANLISSQQQNYISRDNEINILSGEILTKKEELKTEVYNTITEIKEVIKQAEIAISRDTANKIELERQKKELIEGDICPTCLRMKDHDDPNHKEHHDTLIASLEDRIIKLETDIKTNNQIVTNQNLFIATHAQRAKQGFDDFDKEIADIKTNISAKYLVIEKQLLSDINDINGRITEHERRIAEINGNIHILIKEDNTIKNFMAQIDDITKTVTELLLKDTNLSSEISNEKIKINEINQKLTTIPDLLNKINILRLGINNSNNKIENYQNKITELTNNLVVLEENARLENDIQTMITQIKEHEQTIENVKNQKNRIINELQHIDSKIIDCNTKIDMHITYRRTDSSLRIYKQLLGKDGLVASVFASIVNVLNQKLNELLTEVNFRLMFDENGQLKMVDLSKANKPVRNVAFTSGMESTFLGVSLYYVLKILNAAKQFSPLFIDEISGKLNDAKDLTYEAIDYQDKFKNLLHIIKDSVPTYIIDHVVKKLDSTSNIEVVPSNAGSKLIMTEYETSLSN